MKTGLAPALFSIPKPPSRTPVANEQAEAFVNAEKPAAIVHVASQEAPKEPANEMPRRRRAAPQVADAPPLDSSVPKSGMARLSVDIPCSTLRTLKIRAIERGTTVREYVLEMLTREGLSGLSD
jgi:hypothetical protein